MMPPISGLFKPMLLSLKLFKLDLGGLVDQENMMFVAPIGVWAWVVALV
jgi:hypothetical protein